LRCIKLLTGVLLELFLSDQKTINFLGNKLWSWHKLFSHVLLNK
jgi:hypothetical protein